MLKIREDQIIGIEDLSFLRKAAIKSHKGDNGKVFVIGGSETFHGAPFFALKTVSRICDLVYFSSVRENIKLLEKLKTKLFTFIAISENKIEETVKKVDVVLIGPGLEKNKSNFIMVNWLLKKNKNKKFVLDAGAFDIVKKKFLGKNCVLTPHAQEFERFFKKEANQNNVKKMAKKYNCIIVLKGSIDMVVSKNKFMVNKTGNPGMTKGGTGDILAGLIAGFSATNDLYLASIAGVFVNGMAGDKLFNTHGTYYDAMDLLEEIPKTIRWCERLKL